MTSGFWIWLSVPFFLFAVFLPWELWQLKRRRNGNQSALTKSQYATRLARAGNKFMRWYILIFPVFIALVGVWLIFHWSAPCIWFDVLCDFEIKWLDI
jgi:hypothetical protein